VTCLQTRGCRRGGGTPAPARQPGHRLREGVGLEAEHAEPLAALDYSTLAIRN
jgi:hypothetical protein